MPDPIVNLRGTPPETSPYEYTKGLLNNQSGKVEGDGLDRLRSEVFAPAKGPAVEKAQFYNSNEIDRSGRYPWFLPGADNEESYAQGQGVLSKAGHAIWKGLNLAGTTFVQGTLGAVNGVYKMIDDGRLASFYDNDFNRGLDEYNKTLENKFANYYTHKEKDANWYEPSNLFTANFLFDKVIKNMGFTVGSIASGLAWNTVLKLIPTVSKLARFGYGGQMAEELENNLPKVLATQRALKTEETIRGISNQVNSFAKYNPLNKADRAIVAAFGTTAEAGIEALGATNQFRDNLISKYKAENGVEPTGDALDEINKMADHVGNWAFGMNVAILSATNYIQLPHLLGSAYKAEKAAANAIPINAIERDAATGLFKAANRPKTFFGRLSKGIKDVGTLAFSGSEAAEEGLQSVTQIGTQNYWDKRYRGEDANFLSDVLGAGVQQTLSTKEGMESILIGGLSGGIMQSGVFTGGRTGKIAERKELRTNTDKAVQAFNEYGFSQFVKDGVDTVNRGITLQEQREAAIRQGNVLEAKDLKFDYSHNYLTQRIKYGRMDLVKNDLAELKQLASSDEGFAQLQAESKVAATDNRSTFLSNIANLEKHADNVYSLYQSLNTRYGGARNKSGQSKYSPEVIDKMVYAAAKVADYDSRVPELSATLVNAGINPDEALLATVNGEDAQPAVNKVHDAILDLNIIDTAKEELIESFDDLREVAARRNHFLQEYKRLKDNPEEFTEAPSVATATGQSSDGPSTIGIKTKAGLKTLTLGEEYFLGRVVEHDKNGKEVYRFPRMTILSILEGGLLRVKDGNGKIRDIPASALEDYKLGKVSDTLKNKKANYYLQHINDIFEFNFGKGKKQKGRLEYDSDKDRMYFVYRTAKGKNRRIEVTGDQFVAKKGFSQPMISKVGTLTAVQQKALDELSTEQDKRTVDKRKARLEIIQELITDHTARLETITKKIADNQKYIKGIQEEAEKSWNLRKSATNALGIVTELTNFRAELEDETKGLEAERDELELALDYYKDLAQNIDELPTNSTEFLEDLKEQTEDIEKAILETGNSINKISKIIDQVEKALQSAVNIVLDGIDKFTKAYPKAPQNSRADVLDKFLKANPNFLKLNPKFLDDLRAMEDIVGQIDDLDVIPGERTKQELRGELKALQSNLNDLEKQYKIKQALYEKFQKVADKAAQQAKERKEFEANKALHEKIFGAVKDLEKDSGVLSDEPGPPKIEGSASKSAENLFYSTTSPSKELKDHHRREQALLSNAKNFDKREDLRLTIVTAKTEAALGLKGLTALMGDAKDSIAVVYTRLIDNKLHVVDINGNSIGELGQQEEEIDTSGGFEPGEQQYHEKTRRKAIDITKAVFSSLPTAELTWPSSNDKRYHGSDETAKQHQAGWTEKRKEILGWEGDKTQSFPFNISRGIAKRNIIEENGKKVYEKNSAVGTIITEEDLYDEGTIEVSTDGFILHQGQRINVPVGRAMLHKGDTLEWLDNRNLNEDEIASLYKVLRQFVKNSYDGTVDQKLARYLQGVLYFGRPQEGKQPARNQIWFQQGRMHLGQYSFLFTPSEFDNNTQAVLTFLRGTYNNVNSTKLKGDNVRLPFEEIYDIDSDGNPVSRTWESYQHYLLSPTYVLSEGNRTEEHGQPRKNLPLTVSVRKVNKALDPNDSNYEQKYATITGEFYPLPAPVKKEAPKKSAPKEKEVEKKPAAKKQSGYVLDGTTENDFANSLGSITFTAVVKNGQYTIGLTVAPEVIAALDENPQFKAFATRVPGEPDEQKLSFIRQLIKAKIIAQLEAAATPEPIQEVQSAPVVKTTQDEEAELAKAKQIIENAKKSKEESLPDAEYLSLLEGEEIVKGNIDKEQAWFEERFSIPFHRMKTLITNGAGGLAFGKFQDAAVYVYENAIAGATYHEAFHAVFSLFSTLKEKKGMISEFKARKGTFLDRESGRKVKYSDATEKEVREALAEEFRAYMLNGTNPAKTPQNWIKKFFTDLLNFIQRVFYGKNPASISEMFNRINQGYYRNAAPVTTEEIAPEYMAISGFNEQISRSVIEGVTAKLFQKIFSDQSSRHLIEFDEQKQTPKELFDAVYKDLERLYTLDLPRRSTPEEYVKYMRVWDNIQRNWPQVKENVNQYLSTFGIIAKLNQNGDTSVQDDGEETQDRQTDDNANQRDYERDPLKYDFKKTAPASVKLLFATLTDSIGQVANIDLESPTTAKDGFTALERQVKFGKVFNQTLSALLSSNTLEEKQQALRQLALEFPNVVRLYKRLKFHLHTPISVEDWRLRVRFFNVMAKQSPTAYINYVDEAGQSHTGAAELSDAATIQMQRWLDNLKTEASKKGNPVQIERGTGKYIFNTNVLNGLNIKSTEGGLSFLKLLGIDIDTETYKRIRNKNKFEKAVGSLYTFIKKADGFMATSARTLDVAGPMKTIAEAYLKASGEEWESSFLNMDNEKVQKYILPNYLSNVTNDLNNAADIEDAKKRLPQLTTPYAQGSRYIKTDSFLFDRKGKGTGGLNIAYIQGTIDQTLNRPRVPTERLNRAQRLVQEINQNIQKNYYVLVPADSKTEWMLEMDNPISYGELLDNPGAAWNKFYSIFNEYYRVEKEMFNQDGKNRLLADFSNGYKDDSINQGLRDFVQSVVAQQTELLREYGALTTGGISGLDTHFFKTTMGENITDEAVARLLTFRTMNYMINNTELHKIFFGDPAAYTDATKRYKSFLSPREASFYGSVEYNNMANREFNKAGNIALEDGDPGYHVFSDNMYVGILKDVIGYNPTIADEKNLKKEIREPYKENKGADSQSWATLAGYREIWKRAGDRWFDAHEVQYQFEMARDRQLMQEDGLYKYTNPALEAQDKKIVAQGNPHVAVFPVLKPIGTGFTADDQEAFLHKTSLVPLWYSAVRGKNLAHLYKRMMDEGLSYSIVGSGTKVSVQDGQSLYDEDGNPETSEFDGKNIKIIPFRYYGIQVETNGSKDKQTRGSQLTKLAIMNLLDGGVPIDVQAKYDLDNWEKFSEGEKRALSPVYEEVQRNIELLNEMTEIGYRELLDKFGITDDNGEYSLEDKKKIAGLLHKELFRREVPDNIREALTLDENGEFKVPLEAIPSYGQIKAILYSAVDKAIASPKVNGGPKIQVSGSMWESIGARETVTHNGKKVVVSKGLKFYAPQYNDKGELTKVGRMEVMLPNWVAKKLRTKGNFKTDEELIKLMTPDMLSGVGFRIPTQETFSIEAFIIKGFLPEEFGDAVIVPEEITTKAGSDFDVDKLSTYLKNIHVTNTGELHLVEYKGSESETKAYYREFFDTAIENAKKLAQAQIAEIGEAFNESVIVDDMFNEDEEESLEREQRVMDRLTKLGKKLEDLTNEDKLGAQREEFANKMYKQAIENEYFNSLGRILLMPQNFERLITPNNSKELVGLRDELNEVLGVEKQNKGGILNPAFMSNTRHNFIVGKNGVAIAAIQQTNNALSQLANVYIDPERLGTIDRRTRAFMPNVRIALAHNTISLAGKAYATLSKIKDVSGRYISNKVSQYINGYVDIAKDAYVVEIGADPQLASTFLLLNKLGVKEESVVWFMNQPIIREYMKILARSQKTWLFDSDRIALAKQMFPAAAKGIEINESELKQNLIDYTKKGELPEYKNAEQQFILDEFIKYAAMAGQLFELTQGSNYDTSNFSDPNLYYRKRRATDKARNHNIFSSVDRLMNSAHVAKIGQRLGNIRDALGQTVIGLESPSVRVLLDRVLDELGKGFMTEKQFLRAAKRVEQSFISYLVQTKLNLNNRLSDIMVSDGAAIAQKIKTLQTTAKNNPNSSLAYNAFITDIVPLLGANVSDTKNLTLSKKINDAFESNMYTGALRELRAIDKDLYGKVVRLAFLQSGLTKSPISFTELIPWEDYSKIIIPAISDLADPSQYVSFVDNDAFFRNNWRDDSIVPRIKDFFIQNEDTDGKPKTNRVFGEWINKIRETRGIEYAERFIPYKVHENSRNGNSRFLNITRVKAEFKDNYQAIKKMREKKDYSFYEQILVRRVDDADGNPIKTPSYPGAKFNYYTYMPINAWGDGQKAEEYYEYPKPSVLNNNTSKVRQEIPNDEVIRYMEQYGTIAKSGPTFKETKDLSMQPDNIKAIKNRTKTTTIRSELFRDGVYKLPDGSSVVLKLVDEVKSDAGFISKGKGGDISRDEFAKGEGFKNWDDFVKNNKFSKKFVEGKEPRYLYTVSPIEQKCS